MIPTPNNKYKAGEERSKYMINPATTNSYHLNLFEFVGLLMGCSIRTGAHLALDMPSLFWKQLVGQNISLNDLELVDFQYTGLIRWLQKCPSEQAFTEYE